MQNHTSSILASGQRWITFLADREYFSRLIHIAVPIALQTFVMNSLNLVGVMMIGQLGETRLAAVGLANQIFFLLQLLLFGINSGCAMFTAQLWGRQDVPNIRKVLALAIWLSLAVSSLFLLLAAAAPQVALGIYSKDAQVVLLGGNYLRIFGWAFLFFAVSSSYSFVLRSTGNVHLPLYVSMGALSFNMLLSYMLIFGKFGAPRLEVEGAAIAGLVSRILECSVLLWITYRKKLVIAISLREMFQVDLAFARKVLHPVIPVALNELFWSLGITTYNIVYARIGTEAIAAMNIASAIDGVAITIFIGIANACAILVGNLIGAGDEKKAYEYAGRSILLAILCAFMVGGIIFAGSDLILGFYKVTSQVIVHANQVLTIISLMLWIRMTNLMLFIGVFRSGGDTRFAFILDGVIIWVVGVPLAAVGAFVFHFPVNIVYLLVMTEEVTKCAIGIVRFFSKKWIHNLVQVV
jgi:putative MATE family efflux protein